MVEGDDEAFVLYGVEVPPEDELPSQNAILLRYDRFLNDLRHRLDEERASIRTRAYAEYLSILVGFYLCLWAVFLTLAFLSLTIVPTDVSGFWNFWPHGIGTLTAVFTLRHVDDYILG